MASENDEESELTSKLEAMNISPRENDFIDVLDKLENIHYLSGPIYQSAQKFKALILMQSDELQAIYHLCESHSPGLRYKTAYRYERVQSETADGKKFGLNKQHIEFRCKNENINVDVEKMLSRVREMPKEWTIVQLTPQFCRNENVEFGPTKFYTNPIHVTVFSCGKNEPKPFSVTVDAPVDKVTGKVMEIRQEMASIVHENKYIRRNLEIENGLFKSTLDKEMYCEKRSMLNSRLKLLVKDLQENWLKEWRCLLIGKFVDEIRLNAKLKILLRELEDCEVTGKTKWILKCLMKGSEDLKPAEIKSALRYCFSNKKINYVRMVKLIKDLSADIYEMKRHPVILSIDEKLDDLPWEMLDVLQDHPVSRMPSLHFTYALFKEHESSIVNGMKTGIHAERGKYIINPGLDLRKMETRMHKFFQYWRPDWTGPVGVAPTSEEFENILTGCDIFTYNGHGDGSQFLSGDRIQKLRLNSVVFLFGCGSVKYTNSGPRVEMHGSHQTYLIACSPCTVGMLWEVTDIDTDVLATEFWSHWVPSNAAHWKTVDRQMWETTGEIVPLPKNFRKNHLNSHEPELLRALCKAKKAARQYITQAACVARGIPVKLK